MVIGFWSVIIKSASGMYYVIFYLPHGCACSRANPSTIWCAQQNSGLIVRTCRILSVLLPSQSPRAPDRHGLSLSWRTRPPDFSDLS